MKTIAKTPYFLLGGAFILSSCTQEETPERLPDGSDRRIVFHTSLPGLTSRATEVISDLTRFYLTVYDESDGMLVDGGRLKPYYDCLEIEKDEGASSVRSDLCVWPVPGQEADLLHFFAFYPRMEAPASMVNNTSVGDGGTTVGYGIKDFTVAPDIADQVDFLSAYASGSMADNLFSGIRLAFRHQMSRVEVRAKGVNKSCDIEIAGAALGEVVTKGDFTFPASDADGVWSGISKGNVSHIFGGGESIVSIGPEAVSILGAAIDAQTDNCAMVIPSAYRAWSFDTDRRNDAKGLYLNVLLRVIDATNTPGRGQQRYPYTDTTQGLNSPNIPVVYLTVDKATGKNVGCRLYKSGDTYFTDENCTTAYTWTSDESVKEFGWAALPISGEWEPGHVYTYTLDYTYGVGLHGPDVEGNETPKAGDPIISDRVGVALSVKPWQSVPQTGVVVPGS